MDRVGIALFLTDSNRNSLAAVAGAIETTPSTADCPLTILQGIDDLEERLPELCGDSEILIVGFSFGTLELIETAVLLARVRDGLDRCHIDNVILVAGGAHPSAQPEEALKLGFDYVVVGEAEVSFPAFVSAITKDSDPLAIKGIAAMRQGRVNSSGRSERVDLDCFPPLGRRSMIFSYVEITRGCAHACRFCEVSYRFGGRFRHRSIGKIEEAVQFLIDVGRRDIHFLSPDALSYGCKTAGEPNLSILEELLSRAARIAAGANLFFGSFPSEVWPAWVTDHALELIRNYAANDNIIIGAQSGSQQVLDRMRRRHTVQDVVRAVDLILKWGFVANVDFMFGLPGETAEDEEATIDLMRQLADKGANIHSHAFLPLPGTPLADGEMSRLSDRLVKALEELAGSGRQYGSWRTQHEAAERVTTFRRMLREVKDVRHLDMDEFSR